MSPMRIQAPMQLDQLLLLSQEHQQQGSGLKAEHPALELTSMWDADTTGSGFTRCAAVPTINPMDFYVFKQCHGNVWYEGRQ